MIKAKCLYCEGPLEVQQPVSFHTIYTGQKRVTCICPKDQKTFSVNAELYADEIAIAKAANQERIQEYWRGKDLKCFSNER